MQRVLIAVPTHRGIAYDKTKEAIRQLVRLGAEVKLASKISDIAGGRSWLLTESLEYAEATDRDVILCIDDDMDFTTRDAEVVIEHARRTGIAASACYMTEEGNLAGCRFVPRRHLVGLGFCAIPVRLLRNVASRVPYVQFAGKRRIYAFCESRAHVGDDEWRAEDYDLCRKLGGVDLLPIAVGHIKAIALVPCPEDVARCTTWEESPADEPPPPTERG